MTTLTITWNDGTKEDIYCYSFDFSRHDVITICLNEITREYRYIPLASVKEFGKKDGR